MVRGAEALHPGIAGRSADAELPAQLRHVDRTALRLVPAALPFQHEVHPLLHRVRRFQGIARLSAMSPCKSRKVERMSLSPCASVVVASCELSLPRSSGHLRYEGGWSPWIDESGESSPGSTRPRWCSWCGPAARASARWPRSWT